LSKRHVAPSRNMAQTCCLSLYSRGPDKFFLYPPKNFLAPGIIIYSLLFVPPNKLKEGSGPPPNFPKPRRCILKTPGVSNKNPRAKIENFQLTRQFKVKPQDLAPQILWKKRVFQNLWARLFSRVQPGKLVQPNFNWLRHILPTGSNKGRISIHINGAS